MWSSFWLLQMVHYNPNLLVPGALNFVSLSSFPRGPFGLFERKTHFSRRTYPFLSLRFNPDLNIFGIKQAVKNQVFVQLFDFKGGSFKASHCVQHRIRGLEIICMFKVKPVEHHSSWGNVITLLKYGAGVRRQLAKPGAASMALSRLATIPPASVTQSDAPFNILFHRSEKLKRVPWPYLPYSYTLV